nr:nucleoside-diphosphate kinase [uncultured Solibaculum sp.]
MNYSFIMLKPDALDRELVVDVLSYLKKGGIELELVGYQKAKEDVICKHYAEVIEKLGDTFRRRAIRYFDGQPVMPIIVKGEGSDLIPRIRSIVGATDPSKAGKGTIRGDLGTDSLQRSIDEDRCCENLIHASDCEEAFRTETAIWFGDEIAQRYFNKAE